MQFSMSKREACRRTRSVMRKRGHAAKTKFMHAAVDMYEYATRPGTTEKELERAARLVHILHHAAGITFDELEELYRNEFGHQWHLCVAR